MNVWLPFIKSVRSPNRDCQIVDACLLHEAHRLIRVRQKRFFFGDRKIIFRACDATELPFHRNTERMSRFRYLPRKAMFVSSGWWDPSYITIGRIAESPPSLVEAAAMIEMHGYLGIELLADRSTSRIIGSMPIVLMIRWPIWIITGACSSSAAPRSLGSSPHYAR